MLNEEELEQKDEVVLNEPPRPTALSNLTKSQKIMAVSLAFFAVAILVLWSIQFKQSLKSSTTSKNTAPDQQASEQAAEEDNTASLKLKDTDKDGLSDYDELNIYLTSPYLEDSDSDGISDKKEVDNNTDPNCPQGRNCNGVLDSDKADAEVDTQATDSTANSLLNLMESSTLDSTPAASNNTDTTAQNTDTNKLLSGDLDAASLRALLVESGMDKAVLDKISDADLVKSYKETLQSQK